ncbi:hypothetical protein F3Y22_tig00006507pilonHSYRG00094 [Hibiscus syriacus]|uniref:Tr-type G domain-containing protein n=1 Tax=Hibiscus syriacus TaxID=106335 RepID=A0A6A3CDC4_HIBSY|nr:hypothetical protein F3Y22_tig00006507pilonHSYRG00094 [Hibiscus syriacus]
MEFYTSTTAVTLSKPRATMKTEPSPGHYQRRREKVQNQALRPPLATAGEFETGYKKGGQTREHVQLAKTLGVAKLLLVVNKMDEHNVNWYDEIESKMTPFLKSSGYNVKKDVQFLPISGLAGLNMKAKIDKSICPWCNGPCLFEALDRIEVPLRDPKGLFRSLV